jgi:hypothetical protein
MVSQPDAFMSYVRFVDQHEGGQLTEFRERLSAEVHIQTGEAFPIFQDRNDIAWGQPGLGTAFWSVPACTRKASC